MTELGDLLELLHGASRSFRTLRAEARVSVRPTLARSAMTAAMARRATRVRVGGSHSSQGLILPPETTMPEVDQPTESHVGLWVARPGRYREEQRGEGDVELVVRDGARWWSYDTHFGARSNEGDAKPERSRVGGQLEFLADPAGLLASLRFEVSGKGERAQREVLRARAWSREAHSLRVDHALAPLGPGADEYELEVDAERGALLRTAAFLNGAEFSVIEVREIAFDVELPADTFTFVSPDGQVPASDDDASAHPKRVAVHEAATLAPFPVFALSGLPDAWAVFAMFKAGRERPPSPPEVNLMYLAGEATSMVMVNEKSSADAPRPGWERRTPQGAVTRSVERDGLAIRVLEGGSDFGATAVWLIRDDTAIEITSSDLDSEALIELTTRLKPAPTEPPQI